MLPIRTLPQLLLERAAENPSRLVERHKHRGIWRQYTYADLLDNVRAFALGLHAMGLKPGETLAIIGENEPEHFWAEFAALALGGKAVSLYPDLTAAEAEFLLADSEAVYLVAQDQEQVDKGLAVLANVPGLRRIIYWDDTGMWSYRQEALTTFEAGQDGGRKRHAAEPQLFATLVAAGARPRDLWLLAGLVGAGGLRWHVA